MHPKVTAIERNTKITPHRKRRSKKNNKKR